VGDKQQEKKDVDVQESFDVLIGELEAALELAQEDGTKAFQQGQYVDAQAAAQRAEAIKNHIDTLTGLSENWEIILSGTPQQKRGRRRAKRTHLSPGLKTPNSAFRIPILKALVQLGGHGPSREVLDMVELEMKDQLKSVDRELLKDGRTLRWRNTAGWARMGMKDDGLLKPDSPRGIWEITDSGREYLQKYEDKSNS
jgi:restriction system protein